jgi:PAS domain S-box-containing protein/diguanylate cyclase (GGDEF)-like protein
VAELTRQTLELIATSSAEAIVVIDAGTAELPIVYINPAYETLTGYSAEDVVGRRWSMLDCDENDSDELAALKAALGSSEAHITTLPDVRKDGTSWLSRIRVEPIFNRRGNLKQFLVMQSEAVVATETQRGLQVGLLQRELKRARQKAASLDRVDVATGLLRFNHFLHSADRDFRIAKRDLKPVAVAVFEINDLVAYRQTFGDKAGDSCLRMIAAQVTGALRRPGDLCGCDDDQRIVAMTLGQDAKELGRVVERIATNVRRLGLHNPRGRTGGYVTVGFGVASMVPDRTATLASLIDEATAELEGSQAGVAKSQISDRA